MPADHTEALATTKTVLAYQIRQWCASVLPLTEEQYRDLAVVALHLALQREKDSSMPSFLGSLLIKEDTILKERKDGGQGRGCTGRMSFENGHPQSFMNGLL